MSETQLNAEGVTSSDADLIAEDVPPDFDYFAAKPVTVPDDPGSLIDAELGETKKPPFRSRKPVDLSKKKDDDKARSGPPVLDEWMDFFSRVIIRGATEFYISHAFADIDEDLLSEREVKRLYLSHEERDRIAKPFAELANKLKFTRKHGRMVLATAGSIDSVIQLGMWYSRANRIAAKYRNPNQKRQPRRQRRQRQQSMSFTYVPPSAEQQAEEGREYVGTGPDTVAGANGQYVQKPGWRPDIAGEVFNPDSD